MSQDKPLDGVEQGFDELEELYEESTRTVTAEDVAASGSLEDLDALLEESTNLAEARKAAKQGKKMSAEQKELLESVRLAAEAAQWEDKAVYAHLTVISCACGNHFEDFRGYYTYQERRGGGRRLVAHNGKPAAPSVFISEEVVETCHLCFTMGEIVTTDDCDLLAVLGKCHDFPDEDVEEDEPIFNFEPVAEEEVVSLEEFTPNCEEENA